MASDKVLRGKAFKIANYPYYSGYQHELSSVVLQIL